jgi:hypothetical protein
MRHQSIRLIYNMLANLAGPALAWTLFFEDRDGIRGTTVAANYLRMGAVFSVITALLVVLVVVLTFRWREDTRQVPRRVDGGGYASIFSLAIRPYRVTRSGLEELLKGAGAAQT